MSTQVLTPVEEYLRTTYHPDCDYVEGELEERNVGEQPHANVQGILAGIFRDKRKLWGVRALPEQRVQVKRDRFRIPDVCILRNTDPKDGIVAFPPLLCIEVLSPEDRLAKLQERVDDYSDLGVEHIWVVDPWKRVGYVATTRGFQQPLDGVLRIEGTQIEVRLADVFEELDEF